MILVTGANGVVGKPLCERLAIEGRAYIRVSRTAVRENNTLQWDLKQSADDKVRSSIDGITTLIHCAPIWLLPAHLEALSQARLTRLVVFSSTSVLSKVKSANESEQRLVAQLVRAEQLLNDYCAENELALTILRPSLIYGYGRDQNVMHIARFIKKWGVMLLAGPALGKRQPVHADDLVEVSLAVLNKSATFYKAYNLAGQEVLSYRAMVERIFLGLRKSPRIICLPLAPFRVALRLAAKLGRFSYTPEMADRMNQDLVYDISDAMRDFDYRPQEFLSQPERDLAGLI